jgi:hypothetical protein
LRTIYEKSYKRIILLKSQKLKKSRVSGSNGIGVNSGFDNLFHSFSGEFATEIANAIENISSNIFVDAAILAVISVSTLVGILKLGPFVIPIGVGIAGGYLGCRASWSRESVWKSMAEVSIKSILDHGSSRQLLSRLDEELKSSKLFNY